jgi:hypothetical protein
LTKLKYIEQNASKRDKILPNQKQVFLLGWTKWFSTPELDPDRPQHLSTDPPVEMDCNLVDDVTK